MFLAIEKTLLECLFSFPWSGIDKIESADASLAYLEAEIYMVFCFAGIREYSSFPKCRSESEF